ncbi:MAG: GNAT family N-acetyltransferase [Microbacterium sp.]
MPMVTIEPATADRFADAEHALSGGGDGASCQCQWWMLPNKDWERTTRDQREGMLRAELAAEPAPGLIAYVDGEPAAWVRVGPRTAQARLGRTRAFVAHSPEPWDDQGVWAVSCFVVRRAHRGAGLVALLLDAAVAFAREHGARVIEAYPTDTAIAPSRPNDLFVGVLSVFESAGFREVARPKPQRTIVALDLAAS